MDELDRLIQDSYEDDDAAPKEVSDELVDQVEDTTDDDYADADTADDAPLDDDELDPGDDAPEDPDVTQPTPQQPQGPSPEQYRFLQEQHQRQQYALQQLQAERARQQAQAEVDALEARLAEMDPEDAARERLEYVSRTYQSQVAMANQQSQQLLARMAYMEEEAARPTAVQKAIDYYKLPERSRSILMEARDAGQLDVLAQRLQQQNQSQTAKARRAKAQNLQQNPAHRAGAGGKPSVQVGKEPTTLDELVDQMTEGLAFR